MKYQNEMLILQEKNDALNLEIEELKIINKNQGEVIIRIQQIANIYIKI